MTTKSQRLAVVLYDEPAGYVERAGGTLTFAYEPEYLSRPRATPLSLSMPLSATTYTNRWFEAYLRGLLPDNDEVRRRWATHFGLRDRDTFGLIGAIGRDAPGAALFTPESEYAGNTGHGWFEPVDETRIAGRLRRLQLDSTDWLGEDERWSLAGAQSKFTLRRTAAGWAVAHGAEPSTHIVKPGVNSIPGQALIEHVSMVTARSLGLDVARTEYTEFDGQPAIIVERFDRVERAARLVRVHQEDFCQTFGLDPARKYEADRGPGVQRIVKRLRDVTTDDSVRRFVHAVIVNYLLGAPDAHAKNYSLLLVGPVARLAPLYDVASGLTADRDGKLRYPKAAMSFGGERTFGEVRGRHWDRFATRIGMSTGEVRSWVAEFAENLPDALTDAVNGVHVAGADVAMLLPRVRELAERTSGALADAPV